LPSVFGTRQIDDVVICVLAIMDLKTKSCHPRHLRTARLLCLFGCGHALIECNTDPAALPPNDVTVVIAVLDADDKIECSGNADLAFDLKIRTANRHISDQAIDPRAVERDCSGLYDFLALGAAVFVHQNPLMPKRSKFP
jgi:hypothetical protein